MQRLYNEAVGFFKEKAEIPPNFESFPSSENVKSFITEVCDKLKSPTLRLTFLDIVIRRKNDIFLPFVDSLDFVTHILESDFCNLAQNASTEKLSLLTDLCLCAQLISFCLSKSSPMRANLIDGLFDPLTYILQKFVTVDCLTACSTLLISLAQYQRPAECSLLFSNHFFQRPLGKQPLSSPYCSLIRDLLNAEGHQVTKLALIHSFLRMSPQEFWVPKLHEDDELPTLALILYFAKMSATKANNTLEISVLLFLAKIGQILSSRCSVCCPQCEARMMSLFHFCLELKGSSVPVIRHACLDICTNVLTAHFSHCSFCTVTTETGPCTQLSVLLSAIVTCSWSTPGTLTFLSRVLSTILERTGHRALWILTCLSKVSHTRSDSTDEGVAQAVATQLLQCASDPSLGLYVADIYVLLATKLSTEDSTVFQAWLDCLVQISHADDKRYSALINQYLLPKLAAADPQFVIRILEIPFEDHRSPALSLILACYRFLLRPETPAQIRKQVELMTPQRDVMLAALTACDVQLRDSAFELLMALIKSCKVPAAILQHAELFLHFLEHSMWTFERSTRNQIVCAMCMVVRTLMEMRRKQLLKDPTVDTECFVDFIRRLAGLFLESIYPGVPAPRMSLALCSLYSLTTVLPPPGSAVVDCSLHPTCLEILLRAVRSGHASGISDLNAVTKSTDSANLGVQEDKRAQNVLNRLFLGLLSPYEEDREHALQTILLTGLTAHLNKERCARLWFQALAVLAESAKPDVSPLAWNLLRLTVNSTPRPRADSSACCSHRVFEASVPTETTLLGVENSAERACLTIQYLLGSIERVTNLAEVGSVRGLLAMAAKTPFYAMLSALRALLDQFTNDAICSNGNGKPGGDMMGSKKRVPLSRSDRPILLNCLFDRPKSDEASVPNVVDRVIDIAMRITQLILPILAHAAPEGHIPGDDDPAEVDIPDEELEVLLDEGVDQTKQYPEYLTVCCWRSVRELALLLGCCLPRIGRQFSIDCAPSKPADALGFSHAQLLQISEFFCAQLLCGRHGGAVEQCSIGFGPFCRALLCSEDETVKQFPLLWLDTVLDHLLNDVSFEPCADASVLDRARALPIVCLQRLEKTYCVTRRSAGLPLFLQDILSAAWIAHGKDGSLTVATVRRLLTVIEQTFKHCSGAEPDEGLSTRWNWALQRCVITLNVTRTLLRSSVLMQPTAEFTERAMCLAIDGLGCAEWALRNSSGLLFSTLMERLFGVNRSRDMTSRKNCLSSANFFKRYPNLKDHMVQTLKSTTSDLNTPNLRRTRLYSTLLILTRLLPPTQQAAVSGLLEQTFGPFVLKCASSCDIRIRQLAARALLSLVPGNRLPVVTFSYIEELGRLVHQPCERKTDTSRSTSFSRTNLIHGLLLQLQQLLQAENWTTAECHTGVQSAHSDDDDDDVRSKLLTYSSSVLHCLLSPRLNPCPIVRKTALDIFGLFGPADQWDTRVLLRSGLERESNESYARTNVYRWMMAARERYLRDPCGIQSTDIEPIMAPVDRLGPSQIRQAYLHHISAAVSSSLTDDSEANQLRPHSVQTHADTGFARFILSHIGVPELVHVIQTAIPGPVGSWELRDACSVLLHLTVSPAPVSDEIRSALLERAETLVSARCMSPPFHVVACLPPLILLLGQLSDPTDSQIHFQRFAHILSDSVDRFGQTETTLDTDELACAIIRVLGNQSVSFLRMLCNVSTKPVVFLLKCLLNFGQHHLQEEACASCKRMLADPSRAEIGIPQPYVIFPQILRWLISHVGLSTKQLVSSILVPLFQRLSDHNGETTKDIRVFAHGSEDCIFDLMHTMKQAIGPLSTNETEVLVSWERFEYEINEWWTDQLAQSRLDDNLLDTKNNIQNQLSNRFLEFLMRNCSDSTSFSSCLL